MGRTSNFTLHKKDIETFFNADTRHVYTLRNLEDILKTNGQLWGISTYSGKKFTELLIEELHLSMYQCKFHGSKPLIYSWGNVSKYDLYQSFIKESYYTHLSALFFHNLTDQIPTTFHLNKENSTKHEQGDVSLTQEALDAAFSKSTRISSNTSKIGTDTLLLLTGKNISRTGVTTIKYDNVDISLTDIERTLIDAVIRPEYCGGIHEVISAFRKAKGQFSLNRMLSYYKKMDLIYPYHQSLGFILELIGYDDKKLKQFEKFPQEFDFYLLHNMTEKTNYSKRWRLHYPASLS